MTASKHLLSALAAIGVAACTLGAASPDALVDAATLKGMLDQGKVHIVDVREPDEFAAGHIPGAVNAPLSRFDCGALKAPDGKEIVLQCRSAKRSATALAQCAAAGRSDIKRHLAGGFLAWEKASFPIAR